MSSYVLTCLAWIVQVESVLDTYTALYVLLSPVCRRRYQGPRLSQGGSKLYPIFFVDCIRRAAAQLPDSTYLVRITLVPNDDRIDTR